MFLLMETLRLRIALLLSTFQSIKNSSFFLMALTAHSGPWPLIHFRNHFSQTVGLLGCVISPPQGRYINIGQHKQNKHIHKPNIHALSGNRTQIPASEQAKTVHALGLRPRGYWDWHQEYCGGGDNKQLVLWDIAELPDELMTTLLRTWKVQVSNAGPPSRYSDSSSVPPAKWHYRFLLIYYSQFTSSLVRINDAVVKYIAAYRPVARQRPRNKQQNNAADS
jgi:hypothetical protein